MNGHPLVSIGLPVYNGARFLREALEANLSQTVEDVAIEGWRFAIRTPDEGQINALDVGDNTGADN